ncbi:MAG TPA: hypothetical protein VH062_30995 [Polyangiaceae bacterium]|nr:hypothetical protein [Polyangiaceae bacterium]
MAIVPVALCSWPTVTSLSVIAIAEAGEPLAALGASPLVDVLLVAFA